MMIMTLATMIVMRKRRKRMTMKNTSGMQYKTKNKPKHCTKTNSKTNQRQTKMRARVNRGRASALWGKCRGISWTKAAAKTKMKWKNYSDQEMLWLSAKEARVWNATVRTIAPTSGIIVRA